MTPIVRLIKMMVDRASIISPILKLNYSEKEKIVQPHFEFYSGELKGASSLFNYFTFYIPQTLHGQL